jgi:hypothetical protein
MPEEVMKLSDLLKVLKERDLIAGWHTLNVSDQEAGILSYELFDINQRLNKLHA